MTPFLPRSFSHLLWFFRPLFYRERAFLVKISEFPCGGVSAINGQSVVRNEATRRDAFTKRSRDSHRLALHVRGKEWQEAGRWRDEIANSQEITAPTPNTDAFKSIDAPQGTNDRDARATFLFSVETADKILFANEEFVGYEFRFHRLFRTR